MEKENRAGGFVWLRDIVSVSVFLILPRFRRDFSLYTQWFGFRDCQTVRYTETRLYTSNLGFVF